jgi:opacity protein-like surface antigen
MRRVLSFLLALLVFTVAVPTAQAQDEKPVTVNIGGGYTFSLSEVRDHLGDGYNFNLGVTININPSIGIQTEYGFTGLGEKLVDLPSVTPPPGVDALRNVFADMNMHYLNFNLIFKSATESRVKPYGIAGTGVYWRPVTVTTPGAGYMPPYCDPWFYWCYPGGIVPVNYILAEETSTDMGINFGGGVNIALSDAVSFYAESRYHYIWGPELTNAAGESQGKANGQFLPITFGFRF